MRYDKPIYFRTFQRGEYDPKTGDYGPDIPIDTKKYAAVTDSGVETLNLIYGELKQGVKTVRLQRPYNEPFDRIRIGEKVYRVDFSRFNRNFVCSEVQ